MTDRELLERADKALSVLLALTDALPGFDSNRAEDGSIARNAVDTLKAIRARLAEPEESVEPVAWMYDRYSSVNIPTRCVELLDDECKNIRPLYLHPPRPAVRLSDEEVSKAVLRGMKDYRDSIRSSNWLIARAVEAAVLKKNGLEVKDA